MGKKAKFKKIRRLASQMPAIGINVIKGSRITGEELAAKGVKEVEGETIDLNRNYREKKVVQQPLNHHRKMKMLYNKHGVAGVNYYLNAVKNFVNERAINKV